VQVLTERGARYGQFMGHASVAVDIKHAMRDPDPAKFASMEVDQQEALDMIAHKIARIINGDPNYEDSWRDIAGYAQLVADRLIGAQEL
jgi:hypothetical protein